MIQINIAFDHRRFNQFNRQAKGSGWWMTVVGCIPELAKWK
jgi:hypothetical protein